MTIVPTSETTTTTSLPETESLDQTRTSSDVLAEQVGFLRSRVRLVDTDVAALHGEVLGRQLSGRTNEMRKKTPTELLQALADRGLSWRDTARIVQVSIPALRKWREGGGVSGEHVIALARLCAFCEIAEDDHFVSDVAAWLEQPLVTGSGINGLDLAAEGRLEDLIELAAQHVAPEVLLDRCRPGWGEFAHSNAEVFIAPDGRPGVRITP